jgi:hypothetical protein
MEAAGRYEEWLRRRHGAMRAPRAVVDTLEHHPAMLISDGST